MAWTGTKGERCWRFFLYSTLSFCATVPIILCFLDLGGVLLFGNVLVITTEKLLCLVDEAQCAGRSEPRLVVCKVVITLCCAFDIDTWPVLVN